MPRNVRNWWIEASGDDTNKIATGPRSKDAGMEVIIWQRDRGNVRQAFRIVGEIYGTELMCVVQDGQGREVKRFYTER